MAVYSKPVLFFLGRGIPPESLVSLHALLSFDERSAFVFYSGDFSDLLSRYLANPFVRAPWRCNPPVCRRPGEISGLIDRAGIAGILAQASNSAGSRSREEFQALLRYSGSLPFAYLDMADEPGKYDRVCGTGCTYLKGSIFSGFPPGPDVEPAPYLHWGISGSAGEVPDSACERPIDVCFLGACSTHPLRKPILDLVENWAARRAGRVNLGIYLSNASDIDRPSPGKYVEVLSRSRICLDPWGHAAQTKRLYEAMSCGCLAVSQSPRWKPNGWTPVAGRHFASFGSGPELIRVLDYYLEHEEERRRIASQGRLWVNETFAPESIGAWLYRKATGQKRADAFAAPVPGGNT